MILLLSPLLLFAVRACWSLSLTTCVSEALSLVLSSPSVVWFSCTLLLASASVVLPRLFDSKRVVSTDVLFVLSSLFLGLPRFFVILFPLALHLSQL